MDTGSVVGQSVLLVFQIAGPAIAMLIGIAAVWCLRKLTAKLGVQMSAAQDDQVLKIVSEGVNVAEEWARKQAAKPTGNAKADIALGAVRELLETKTYQTYGEAAIRNLIDSAVAKMNAGKVVAPVADAPKA